MSIGDFELLLTAQGLLKQCLSQDPKSFNMELETNHEPPRPEGQENNSAMIPYVIRKLSVGENVNKLEEREDEIKVERMKDNEEIAFTSTSRLHQVPLIVTIVGCQCLS